MRKFVIMEVKRAKDKKRIEDKELWFPIDVHDNGLIEQECLWLKPEHVIAGHRLRYGICKHGEVYFANGWHNWPGDENIPSQRERLILDPPKQGEFEEWVDDMPKEVFRSDLVHIFQKWLKKMPRGK